MGSPDKPSRLIPLIIACGLFMENLDSTAIATSLPQIARSLGEPAVNLSMAMTAYMLALAAVLPVGGWLADRFGARRVFALAIVMFTAGSIFCGLSSGLATLVLARALQGAGGAMMTPVGRIVILKTVPKEDLVRANSLFTTPALIGPTVGPLIGGFITTYWSWRWIFFVNLPIAIAGFICVLRFVPDVKEETPDPFDARGTVLVALALVGSVLGLENVGRGLLSPVAIAAILAAAAVAAWVYVRHARKLARPAVDLSLFRLPTFFIAVVGGSLFRVGIGAIPFLLPMLFQVGFGLSAIASGGMTFLTAVGAMSMKMLAPGLFRRYGFRSVMLGNAVLSSAFIIGFGGFRPWMPASVIMLALLASGFVRSLQFTGLNTLGYAEVPRDRSSAATTVWSVMQQLSFSIGVATGASVVMATTAIAGTPTPGPAQFMPAFLVVGLISASSALFLAKLTPNAGAEISGHHASSRPSGA